MGSPMNNKAMGLASFHLGTVAEKSRPLWEFGDIFEVQTSMTLLRRAPVEHSHQPCDRTPVSLRRVEGLGLLSRIQLTFVVL